MTAPRRRRAQGRREPRRVMRRPGCRSRAPESHRLRPVRVDEARLGVDRSVAPKVAAASAPAGLALDPNRVDPARLRAQRALLIPAWWLVMPFMARPLPCHPPPRFLHEVNTCEVDHGSEPQLERPPHCRQIPSKPHAERARSSPVEAMAQRGAAHATPTFASRASNCIQNRALGPQGSTRSNRPLRGLGQSAPVSAPHRDQVERACTLVV
jgi:hypothetical protein